VATAPAEPRRRRGRRVAALVTLVGLLLVVGAGAGWAYVRSQYYVGADGEQVAVFRGVNSQVAGVDLSSVEERSDLTTDQLGELDAARVKKGIVAKSKHDAEQILERLKTLACPVATVAPQPSATAIPSTGPSPTISVLPAPVPSAATGCS
jgi:protein phosphatase